MGDCRGKINSDKVQHVEYLNKKGKVVECDILESGCIENTGWKENGSSTEVTASTSEKDLILSKVRSQSVKNRQAMSGPLVPGSVLSHSLSERGRVSERFVMDLFPFSYFYAIVYVCLRQCGDLPI